MSLYTSTCHGRRDPVGAVGDGTLVIDDIAIVDPWLTLSPPTGTYTTGNRSTWSCWPRLKGRSVASGSATFDGLDVTSFVVGCIRPGTGAGACCRSAVRASAVP